MGLSCGNIDATWNESTAGLNFCIQKLLRPDYLNYIISEKIDGKDLSNKTSSNRWRWYSQKWGWMFSVGCKDPPSFFCWTWVKESCLRQYPKRCLQQMLTGFFQNEVSTCYRFFLSFNHFFLSVSGLPSMVKVQSSSRHYRYMLPSLFWVYHHMKIRDLFRL